MKAKLEFDLDDPSDRLAHKRAISSTDAYIALHDIDNMLRKYTKYSEGISAGDRVAMPEGYHDITETESQLMHILAEIIRTKVSVILEDRGVNLDDLE